ncbi:MAG: hypothetical protein ACTHKT_06115 [Solirubrobacterales bacterium]
MHKKIMLACMAIIASVAFVIAPAASASPVLTHNGTIVPVGTKVIATNTGLVTLTLASGQETTCTHAKLTGEVTKNSGSVVEGSLTTKDLNGTGTSTDCTDGLLGPFGVTIGRLCMKVAVSPADTAVFTGCGGPVALTLNFTGFAPCKYSRNELQANFTTGGTQVTVTNAEEISLIEGGSFCPAGFFLDLTFDLWTDGPNSEELGVPLAVS